MGKKWFSNDISNIILIVLFEKLYLVISVKKMAGFLSFLEKLTFFGLKNSDTLMPNTTRFETNLRNI